MTYGKLEFIAEICAGIQELNKNDLKSHDLFINPHVSLLI